MKKQLTTTLFTIGSIGSIFAQLPVSKAPQNKHIILEEYSGIHCGACPWGHEAADKVVKSNPGSVLINIQSGGLAIAKPGEPDLTTPIGDAISNMPGMGITGWPMGDINRTVLEGTSMAFNWQQWAAKAPDIASQPAYCNVAVEGRVDAVTRVLTYTAQVYYTANSPVSTNSLTVLLLENKVKGPQKNYGNPLANASNYNPDGTYNHNHLLRAGVTPGYFGIKIPVTTTGTTFTTTGSYTIPATYGKVGNTNPCTLTNIELVAFVTQTNKLTINGVVGPVKVTNVVSGLNQLPSNVNDINVYPNPASNNATIELNLAQDENISINVTNIMGQNVFNQTLNDLPAGTQSIKLNSENWVDGIYNINISTKNGNICRKLEIIK